MEYLPIEITDIILEYKGYHKLRNGKYIPQLYLEDKKYDEIKKRSIPKMDIYTSVYSVKINKIAQRFTVFFIYYFILKLFPS